MDTRIIVGAAVVGGVATLAGVTLAVKKLWKKKEVVSTESDTSVLPDSSEFPDETKESKKELKLNKIVHNIVQYGNSIVRSISSTIWNTVKQVGRFVRTCVTLYIAWAAICIISIAVFAVRVIGVILHAILICKNTLAMWWIRTFNLDVSVDFSNIPDWRYGEYHSQYCEPELFSI